MKKKIIYFPDSNLDKELFIKEIHNYKDIEFIGSVDTEKALFRFINLYEPDFIIFYSSYNSLDTHLKCSAKILTGKSKTKTVFILDENSERYTPICLRAGASYVFSTKIRLKNILNSLETQEERVKIPTFMLHRFINPFSVPTHKEQSTPMFKKILEDYLKNDYKMGKFGLKKDISVTKWCYKFKNRLKMTNRRDLLTYLIYDRYLPKKH